MRFVLLASAAALALSGCGRRESALPPDEAAATMTAAAPAVVRFVAHDFSFEGPDTIGAGMVTLVLANEGATWHHLQMIRLPDDMTFEEVQAGLASMEPGSPPPAWMDDVAGGVNPPEVGHEARVTQVVEPGAYVILCVVDTPDHVPHMMKGMIRPLTVIPATGPAVPAPESDLTLTLADYSFSFSAAPTAGEHVIHVVNAGPQAHEVAFFKIQSGKTVDDFMAWAQTYEGPPPAAIEGGVPAFQVGQEVYSHVTFSSGDWLALCFVPDVNDGQPHLAHGMMLAFHVD
jgi:hypothetical protein